MLLGKQVKNSNIECDRLGVRAIRRGNPNIKVWELWWRKRANEYFEIECSIKFKGCMILGHSSVMNVIKMVPDFHIVICPLPIRKLEKKANFVAVFLPLAKCTKEVSRLKSMENCMQFDADRLVSGEEFMIF